MCIDPWWANRETTGICQYTIPAADVCIDVPPGWCVCQLDSAFYHPGLSRRYSRDHSVSSYGPDRGLKCTVYE